MRYMTNISRINEEIINYFFFKKKTQKVFDSKYLVNNNLYDYYEYLQEGGKDKYNKKLEEVEKILEILNGIEIKSGIPYFCMKSFYNYPFIDNDIDIIVLDDGYKYYVDELKSIGYFHLYDIADYREPNKKMYKNNNALIMPHIHREVAWNGIITCDKNSIYKKSIVEKINGIKFRIPSFTDELLIAVCHFLFENYYFKIGDFIYLKYLLDQEIDYHRIEEISKEFGYNKGIPLFFSYLYGLSDHFKIGLNINGIYSRYEKVDATKPFPYYIPYHKLIPVYVENFRNGIRKKQLLNLFRKLFTFILVGYLWKYLLPKRRQKKYLLHFQD